MTCNGCANAVRGVLSKLDGIQSVEIDVPTQRVVIIGPAPVDVLQATIRKTGKQTTFVSNLVM